MSPRNETDERSALNEITKAAGQKIALARKAAGFKTQEDLAAAIGVRQSTVYRWEIGERIPRLQHQLALVDVLGQPHSFLFGITSIPKRKAA